MIGVEEDDEAGERDVVELPGVREIVVGGVTVELKRRVGLEFRQSGRSRIVFLLQILQLDQHRVTDFGIAPEIRRPRDIGEAAPGLDLVIGASTPVVADLSTVKNCLKKPSP